MNDKELAALLGIINVLAPMGLAAVETIGRAVRAIRGPEATAEEIAADIAWLKTDAHARRELSRLAAGLPALQPVVDELGA